MSAETRSNVEPKAHLAIVVVDLVLLRRGDILASPLILLLGQ